GLGDGVQRRREPAQRSAEPHHDREHAAAGEDTDRDPGGLRDHPARPGAERDRGQGRERVGPDPDRPVRRPSTMEHWAASGTPATSPRWSLTRTAAGGGRSETHMWENRTLAAQAWTERNRGPCLRRCGQHEPPACKAGGQASAAVVASWKLRVTFGSTG